jgi:hypothetical protein
MVFVEPSTIGIEPLFESWYKTLPLFMSENLKIMTKIKELKRVFVIPILV